MVCGLLIQHGMMTTNKAQTINGRSTLGQGAVGSAAQPWDTEETAVYEERPRASLYGFVFELGECDEAPPSSLLGC